MKYLPAKPKKIALAIVVILVIGVVGVITFFVFDLNTLPEEQVRKITTASNEINLSYRSYDPATVQLISSFEEKEDIKWQGDGFYDDRQVFTDKTSLALASTDRQESSAFTTELPSLGEFTHLEVGVSVTDPDDLESLTIYAGNSDQPKAYAFRFSNLLERWNILRLPREQFVPIDSNPNKSEEDDTDESDDIGNDLPWEDVNRLEFSLLSRPGRTMIANIDSLRIERTRDYLDDWNVNISAFLGLAKHNNEVYLLGRGTGAQMATIEQIPSARDFIYRTKLIPLNDRRSGLFFRGDFRSGQGYSFWIGGVNANTWGVSIHQSGAETFLETGELTNVLFREEKPIWLEVQAQGETLSARLSLDGEHYNELVNISDPIMLDLTGGVGIFAEGGALTLYNDFYFSQ